MTTEAFPDIPEFNDTFRAMFTDMYGMVYAGFNLEATIATIKWLRTHPQQASALLADYSENCIRLTESHFDLDIDTTPFRPGEGMGIRES